MRIWSSSSRTKKHHIFAQFGPLNKMMKFVADADIYMAKKQDEIMVACNKSMRSSEQYSK